jgi:hypothetical protein
MLNHVNAFSGRKLIEKVQGMFLDMHPTGGVNEEMLKKMQNELPDEFGVTTENIL